MEQSREEGGSEGEREGEKLASLPALANEVDTRIQTTPPHTHTQPLTALTW